MKIEKRKKEILEIQESVKIVQDGHDIILEAGDRIEVLPSLTEGREFEVIFKALTKVGIFSKLGAVDIVEDVDKIAFTITKKVPPRNLTKVMITTGYQGMFNITYEGPHYWAKDEDILYQDVISEIEKEFGLSRG